MTIRSEHPVSTPPFAGPRSRRGLKDAAVVAAWLTLCAAFVVEILPVRSATDRLYELEAARDRFARSAATPGEGVVREARPAPVLASSAQAAARRPVRPSGLAVESFERGEPAAQGGPPLPSNGASGHPRPRKSHSARETRIETRIEVPSGR
jgi:hypothetical protein